MRLAALKASWKRDIWVSRRRLWWRWTLWGAQRYALPAAAVLGVCAGLWFAAKATLAWSDAPAFTEAVVAKAAPTAPLTPTRAAPPPTETAHPDTASVALLPTITMVLPSGMTLAFEAGLPSSDARAKQSTRTPVSSAASPDVAKIPNPQLISENWLHSKEP